MKATVYTWKETKDAFKCWNVLVVDTNSQHQLNRHVLDNHELSRTSLTLVSNADDSSWKYVNCTICNKRFRNEYDMKYHEERVHDFGEICVIYPCEECGSQGQDLDSLESLEELVIRQLPEYSKRTQQN